MPINDARRDQIRQKYRPPRFYPSHVFHTLLRIVFRSDLHLIKLLCSHCLPTLLPASSLSHETRKCRKLKRRSSKDRDDRRIWNKRRHTHLWYAWHKCLKNRSRSVWWVNRRIDRLFFTMYKNKIRKLEALA